MRFMMLMYPGSKPEEGVMPSRAQIDAMMKYNAELSRAGVLLSLDGLQPASKGARIRYKGGKPTVTDGPFTESKEVLGGYWMIQVKSREDAIAWAAKCPAGDEETIEVRQVYEMSDFPADTISEESAERAAEISGRL
ncbi:MAG: YciI family protein [Acidobacteriota bacterium]|nr:YciI family protein [Acidobacteriota bacterium]